MIKNRRINFQTNKKVKDKFGNLFINLSYVEMDNYYEIKKIIKRLDGASTLITLCSQDF